MEPCGSSTWQPPPPPSPRPSGRRAKVELLADALRRLDPDEIAPGAGYLAGELRQRQTGVGYASLRDLPPPAAEPTLTVAAVDAAIGEIAAVHGRGLPGPSPGAARRPLRARPPPTSSGC